jgi:cytochrome c oxidase subunit 4
VAHHPADTAHHAEAQAHDHPGELTYIKVAIILAMITMVEVAIYYIPTIADSGVFVPILLMLSAIKFATVVGYFMHLKFDHRSFLYVFAGGLFVGASIVIALDVLHDHHVIDYGVSFLHE